MQSSVDSIKFTFELTLSIGVAQHVWLLNINFQKTRQDPFILRAPFPCSHFCYQLPLAFILKSQEVSLMAFWQAYCFAGNRFFGILHGANIYTLPLVRQT